MSETGADQEQVQQPLPPQGQGQVVHGQVPVPVQGQARHYQNKQNSSRSQFHKNNNSGIQGGRSQAPKHYQTQRPYQGKSHSKNARSQRNEYGSLQNIPPYMQYYPGPVANGFPNPAPGGFYSYSPTPYYSPATMGYEGAMPPTMMNPKYKVSQESSESSTPSSATTTPITKKIEITNKLGDHVDLSAIHLAQHATEATPMTTAGATIAAFTEGPVLVSEGKRADENTKKAQLDFLAEVKRRKEMLAKKKAVDDTDDTIDEDTLDQTKDTEKGMPLRQDEVADSVPHEVSIVDSKDEVADSVPQEVSVVDSKDEVADSVPQEVSIVDSKGEVADSVPQEVSIVDSKDEVKETSPADSTHDPKPDAAIKLQEKHEGSSEGPTLATSSDDSIDDEESMISAEDSLAPALDSQDAAVEAVNSETVSEEPSALTFSELLRLKKAKETPASGTAATSVITTPAKELAPLHVAASLDDASVIGTTTVQEPVDIPPKAADEAIEVYTDAEEPKKVDEPVESKEAAIPDPVIQSPVSKVPTENPQPDAENVDDADDDRLTMSEFLAKLETLPAVEDIYTYKYPDIIEAPSDRFKKQSIKYTYPPEFLLQFGDKINLKLDSKWKDAVVTKIVIPPGSGKSSRTKGGDRFSGSSFNKKSSSIRMGDRSNSKSMSKRSKSKRMGDEMKSNRASYTSRKEREAKQEAEERQREDVAPLVPSANRWIPKSKLKKTEKKLAPDGVTELLEKEETERKMKSLLNKLTLEKFDPISEEIIGIANQSKWEENGETLKVVIEQIFLKATDEPHWSSMYAQLCGKVVKDLDKEIKDQENEGKVGPILVLHYLFDRCQTEFQKGWADSLPTAEDGTAVEVKLMSDDYYKAAAAKRRGLGLVRLIGFLYRSNLLTSKMMFQCFRRLMKDLTGEPSEETLESVIELLNTVGEQFERDSLTTSNGSTLEGSALLDQLFVMLDQVIGTCEISSRIKFSLLDLKDMRRASWNGGAKDEGPKTISQIHEEEAAKKAAEERERRMRGSSRSASRHQNSSIGGRTGSKKGVPTTSKDDFITTRSPSSRFSQQQKQLKEDVPMPQASSNMFSALMGHDDEEDEEEDD